MWLGTLVRGVGAAVLLAAAAEAAQADLADPGPYAAGWASVTVTRANGTTFTARLFYPAMTAGQNSTFNATGSPYPAISFGHGFVQTVSQYQSTCSHLATRGYFVIASDSEGGLSPSHANFASDMSRCLTYLEQQNTSASSPYFGRVNVNAFGMSGHSMGGGASVLAAAADSRVRALANMAPAETNPSAVGAAAGLRIPASFICGSSDTIVATGSNGQLIYNATSAPKQLPLIAGGYHCGFVDADFIFCDSGTIARAVQLADTRRLLTAFFDLYLKGDQARWPSVWGSIAPDSAGVSLTANAGITLSPAVQSAQVPLGVPGTVTLTLVNTGSVAASYTILADGAGGWTGAATGGVTQVVTPGGSVPVVVQIRAPGMSGAASAGLVVSARSSVDGGTRAWATVNATRWPCTADFNGVDGLTIQDIFDFLNSWLGGDPSADFDGVNGLQVADIFAFLNAWFVGC